MIPDLPPMLPLSQVFGPTFQGEGPHCGRRVGFVRLGYCNLDCTWCDTPYTWDAARFDLKAENPPTAVAEIRARVDALNVDTVVLSGGEPMMWTGSQALQDLLAGPWEWHVETNGTKVPPDWWPGMVTHTTVSPKLAHSGVDVRRRIVPEALTAWSKLATYSGRVAFKFVARDPADLDELDALVARYQLPHRYVWVMPEGTDPMEIVHVQRRLADPVLMRGYNLTTRLHTLLWRDDKER